MQVGKAILITLVTLALLQFLTLTFRTEHIEADLLRRTRQRLEQGRAGIAIAQVSFAGRDATLEGPVSSEEEKLRVEGLVGVYPVRVVQNNLEVTLSEEAAANAMPPSRIPDAEMIFMLASSANQQLLLTGRLPDAETRDRFLQAARSSFPGHTVTDATVLDAGTAGPWVDGVLSMLPSISAVLRPALRVSATAVELRGDVPTTLQETVVLQDARAALAEVLPLQTNLRVLDAGAAPASASVIQMRQRLEAVLAGHRVQFLINTAELVPASKELLNRVAAVLGEAEDVHIEVQGHTDILGSVAMNNALSQSRADAVRDYLISQGIAPARLTAIGYGPTRPVATNTTQEGRIKNRRVEFSLKGGS
ncbi:MAG: OmpA family protein [Rhodothermales bacterium]